MTQHGTFGLKIPTLMERLSHALYSSPKVAMRELVQNAHDAAVFKRMERSRVNAEYKGEVEITLDNRGADRILKFRDNGIGMSEKDLVEELSIIGETQKVEDLKSVVEQRGRYDQRVIGQYGIGFLAAFLIGQRIDVYTRKEHAAGYHWWSVGDDSYHYEEWEPDLEHGTEVVVTLKPDEEIPSQFLSIEGLKELASEYAALLQVPIYVRGSLVNRWAEHWSSEDRFARMPDEQLRSFLRDRFPVEFLDMFRVVYSGEDIQHGRITYRAALFVGVWGLGDHLLRGTPLESTGKGIDLYVRGMFVNRVDNFMPTWASFVHGAIDIDQMNLDLSRERIREDSLLEAVQETLSKKVVDRFQTLHGTENLRRIVDVHRPDLLTACFLHGERRSPGSQKSFLDEMSQIIPFETTHGRKTIAEYLGDVKVAARKLRSCEENTIYCLPADTGGGSESMLAADMGWPVMLVAMVEQKVLDKLEEHSDEISIKKIRAEELFPEAEKAEDDEVLSPEDLQALFLQQLRPLGLPDLEVQVKWFRPSYPAMLLVDREDDPELDTFFAQMERAVQEKRVDAGFASSLRRLAERRQPGSTILFVNRQNAIVKKLASIHKTDPNHDLVRLGCRTIYHSALLQSSHGGLSIEDARIVADNFNEALGLVIDLSIEKRASEEAVPKAGASGPVASEPFVFLAHPFSEKSVDAAIAAVRGQVEALLELKAKSAREEVFELKVPGNVRALIERCRFAVADITGNNPNVMIEIGMLEMLGKPVVKIRNGDDSVRIPINVGADLYCTYEAIESRNQPGTWDVGSTFVSEIRRHLERAEQMARSQ